MEARTDADIIGLFETACAEQLALCDTLEAIADSLPQAVDRQACIHTARALGSVIERAHRTEEEVIFPALERFGALPLDPGQTLERLKLEHAGDTFFAEELIEVLMSYGRGSPAQNAEATGYMLRGFFEALRRHVAFETEVFGPVLARIGEARRAGD